MISNPARIRLRNTSIARGRYPLRATAWSKSMLIKKSPELFLTTLVSLELKSLNIRLAMSSPLMTAQRRLSFTTVQIAAS